MKLAAKLVAIVLLEIGVLLAIDGYLAVQRETRLYQADMQRDAHLLGNTLKHFVAQAWRTEGQERALQLLDKANHEQHQQHIRWVWLSGTADPRYRPLAPAAAITSVAKGQELTVPATDQEGQRHSCTYVPISLPLPEAAAIELAEPLSQLDSFAGRIAARNLVLGLVLATAGGASVVSLGVVLVGRPLYQLSEKARQIGQGDLTPSLNPRGHDELAELARSMNDTCRKLHESEQQTRREQDRRIAAIEQLRQADRLRTVGQLAAEIAHELGTPLNTISIRSGMVADGKLTPDEINENAKIIKSQSQRMTATIRQLLDNARPRPPKQALVDLREVARDTITLWLRWPVNTAPRSPWTNVKRPVRQPSMSIRSSKFSPTYSSMPCKPTHPAGGASTWISGTRKSQHLVFLG